MKRHFSGSATFIPDTDLFIDAAAVTRRVTFSLQHIGRLERAGLFPRRAKLGTARIGWSLAQVTAWMQAKVDARRDTPTVIVTAQERFLTKAELKKLVLYSPQNIRLLELKGQFPKRLRIGDNRVAWLQSEVRAWMEARLSAARGEPVSEDQSPVQGLSS